MYKFVVIRTGLGKETLLVTEEVATKIQNQLAAKESLNFVAINNKTLKADRAIYRSFSQLVGVDIISEETH